MVPITYETYIEVYSRRGKNYYACIKGKRLRCNPSLFYNSKTLSGYLENWVFKTYKDIHKEVVGRVIESECLTKMMHYLASS